MVTEIKDISFDRMEINRNAVVLKSGDYRAVIRIDDIAGFVAYPPRNRMTLHCASRTGLVDIEMENGTKFITLMNKLEFYMSQGE